MCVWPVFTVMALSPGDYFTNYAAELQAQGEKADTSRIEFMKKEWAKPDYAKMKLVTTVYGDDVADKSYRETQGLIKAYPNLKGIIAPTSVGIVAAAKAVVDANLVGKLYVTGLGLPSEVAPKKVRARLAR